METKNKILKLAKGCHIASKVLYFGSMVACLTFTVLAIVLPCVNVIKDFSVAEVATLFGTLAFYSFMCIGLFWNVGGIFKSIINEQAPFSARVSHYLKKTAIFIIVMALVPALVGSTVVRLIDTDTTMNFPISFGGVIAGVVLFVVGVFFKYGKELQTKEDETL